MIIGKLFESILNRIYRLSVEFLGSDARIGYFRKQGMKIGENCLIAGLYYTDEAYLIQIGDHVAIAAGTKFITHDGGLWCFNQDPQEEDLFGMIKIGNNVHIGMNCILLPNTTIGNNCIIAAGSIVRGTFPDNSVILGNPAKVVTNMSIQRLIYSQNPNRLRTARLSDKEKKPIVKKHFGIE